RRWLGRRRDERHLLRWGRSGRHRFRGPRGGASHGRRPPPARGTVTPNHRRGQRRAGTGWPSSERQDAIGFHGWGPVTDPGRGAARAGGGGGRASVARG